MSTYSKQVQFYSSHRFNFSQSKSRNPISFSFVCTAAPPVILQPESGQVTLLTEGQNHQIVCSAKGFPFPHVSWNLTNRVSRYSEESGGNFPTYEDLPDISSTLTLEEVVPELSGTYTCRAFHPGNNGDSSAQKHMYLAEARVSMEVIVSSKFVEFF